MDGLSIDDELQSTIPDEILFLPQKSHYHIKQDVKNAINVANQYRGHVSEMSPRDVQLNSIIETDEEMSSSLHNTSPYIDK